MFPAERMCKHFEPQELDVEYDGGTTTLQIVGMIGGQEARNELPTYGKHSTQFGVWFAKDHIKVERANDTISSDNEFLHFFFIANCQDIELSANRETIRNKSSPVYQAIKDEVEFHLSKIAADPWFEEYLEIRQEAKHHRRSANQRSSLKERRQQVEHDGFVPENKAEVLLALNRAASKNQSISVSVEDFEPKADVHAIVRRDGRLRNAAVHTTLTGLLDEEIPMENVDEIICWEHGDPASLNEYERHGYFGGNISFDLENGGLEYQNHDNHYVEIIEVKSIQETTPPLQADD
jgi:hypothetical protein